MKNNQRLPKCSLGFHGGLHLRVTILSLPLSLVTGALWAGTLTGSHPLLSLFNLWTAVRLTLSALVFEVCLWLSLLSFHIITKFVLLLIKVIHMLWDYLESKGMVTLYPPPSSFTCCSWPRHPSSSHTPLMRLTLGQRLLSK